LRSGAARVTTGARGFSACPRRRRSRGQEGTLVIPTNPPQFQKIESEQREKIVAGREPPAAGVWGPPVGLFSYFVADRKWAMHHAAPFAAVRWTNIHDPHRLIFQGDIISGPVAPVFGPGVLDIDLKALRGQSRRFSHTRYWTLTA